MALEIVAASDCSALVRVGREITPEVQREVWAIARGLRHAAIRNLHPGYGSVLVSFDPLAASHSDIEKAIRAVPLGDGAELESRLVEVPVCYGGELGPDLDDVAALTGLTTDEVVRKHSSAEYLVYFTGFSPGFPYLGGLPDGLAVPRLAQPRTHTPAGSVAIGGRQTGVYPLASPGGWRIIGRTPLRIFAADREPPALLLMGDRVRFIPISRADFDSR